MQLIDVATGWSERAAVLGRSGVVVEAGFRRILACLPFALVELHPDNGSEFLNNHLWRFFKDELPGLHRLIVARAPPCFMWSIAWSFIVAASCVSSGAVLALHLHIKRRSSTDYLTITILVYDNLSSGV